MSRGLRLVPAMMLSASVGCMPTHVKPAELMVDASVAVAGGEDVGRLTGNGARAMASWLAVGVSQASATSHPIGRPCGGFVEDPAPCGEQPLVQHDEVTRFSAGYLLARESDAGRMIAIPYAGVAYLEQERIGLLSGARVGGDGGGLLLGATAGVQYNLFGGLWLGLLGDAALIMPPEPGCADCHVPYLDWIGLAGLSLTASWRFSEHER